MDGHEVIVAVILLAKRIQVSKSPLTPVTERQLNTEGSGVFVPTAVFADESFYRIHADNGVGVNHHDTAARHLHQAERVRVGGFGRMNALSQLLDVAVLGPALVGVVINMV